MLFYLKRKEHRTNKLRQDNVVHHIQTWDLCSKIIQNQFHSNKKPKGDKELAIFLNLKFNRDYRASFIDMCIGEQLPLGHVVLQESDLKLQVCPPA